MNSMHEFHQMFPTDDECIHYLYQRKWPSGYECPRCGYHQHYLITTRKLPLYECHACRHQTSLTAGTVMEKSSTPLRKWLAACYLMSSPTGTNARQLSEIINVTYKTAWSMLRKLRAAMSQANNEQVLTGSVVVNLDICGRPYNPTIQRHPQEQPVFIASSLDAEGNPDHFKLKLIPHEFLNEKIVLKAGIEQFISDCVQSDESIINIVALRYSSLRNKMLKRHFTKARQWLNQLFYGLGRKHLQYYLDEFCFRLNNHLKFPNDTLSVFNAISRVSMRFSHRMVS